MNTRKLLVSVLMLVCVLLSACTSAKATPPAPIVIPPTAVPTAAPAQEGTTFSPKTFDIPFTLVYGPEWKIDAQQSNLISFTYKDYDGSFSFIDSKSTKIAGPAAPYSVIPFPADFVNWIQAHGLFDVVKTQSVIVGGLPGIQIDADATPACERTSWFFTASGNWNCGLGDHYRFIYMDDVNGEQFLIMTQGYLSAQDFTLMVDASQKILDTVVFSMPAATVLSEYPLLIEYELPTAASEPGGIVVGPDGALWFVETAVNKIGRISTDGVITEYPVPTAGAIDRNQGFLAVGSDGALWFNEDRVNQIGRITTDGQITEFALPDEFKPTGEQDSPIRAIVTGPDGALWVTSSAVNAIVKLTMDGNVAAKYVLPTAGSLPVGMVVGPDGALWFVEKGANQIGRITLDGELKEYALPNYNSGALRMTVGPDQGIWFTMANSNKIGRISVDGKITEFDAAGMLPVGITSGADGALWFTGYASNEIGRMTTDGVLTKIQIPTAASVPYHITVGPDGNLWFTEQRGNKIGQILLSAP